MAETWACPRCTLTNQARRFACTACATVNPNDLPMVLDDVVTQRQQPNRKRQRHSSQDNEWKVESDETRGSGGGFLMNRLNHKLARSEASSPENLCVNYNASVTGSLSNNQVVGDFLKTVREAKNHFVNDRLKRGITKVEEYTSPMENDIARVFGAKHSYIIMTLNDGQLGRLEKGADSAEGPAIITFTIPYHHQDGSSDACTQYRLRVIECQTHRMDFQTWCSGWTGVFRAEQRETHGSASKVKRDRSEENFGRLSV